MRPWMRGPVQATAKKHGLVKMVRRHEVCGLRDPDQPLKLVRVLVHPMNFWDMREEVHTHASTKELVIKNPPTVRKYLIEAGR
jgi:hypothetical protein